MTETLFARSPFSLPELHFGCPERVCLPCTLLYRHPAARAVSEQTHEPVPPDLCSRTRRHTRSPPVGARCAFFVRRYWNTRLPGQGGFVGRWFHPFAHPSEA